jgi:translation elongation factor EF-1alpha
MVFLVFFLIFRKKERFEHIKTQLSPFLQIYYSLQDIIFIPIDGLDDTNITTTNLPAGVDWYSGKCLLDIFDEIPTIKRQHDPIRIPILDRMKDQGQQYLFGKIESGCIREDMWVMMMPYKIPF